MSDRLTAAVVVVAAILLAGVLLLVAIAASEPSETTSEPYDRALYPHWGASPLTPCRDVRTEALIRDAIRVELSEDGCRVIGGLWTDPYDPHRRARITDPSDLDVDHLIPLKRAHEAGGWRWDRERRRAYANDLFYAGHLAAVGATTNRAKGSRGPDQWTPPVEMWCDYGTRWAVIAFVWGLEATDEERAAVRRMVETCR